MTREEGLKRGGVKANGYRDAARVCCKCVGAFTCRGVKPGIRGSAQLGDGEKRFIPIISSTPARLLGKSFSTKQRTMALMG